MTCITSNCISSGDWHIITSAASINLCGCGSEDPASSPSHPGHGRWLDAAALVGGRNTAYACAGRGLVETFSSRVSIHNGAKSPPEGGGIPPACWLLSFTFCPFEPSPPDFTN